MCFYLKNDRLILSFIRIFSLTNSGKARRSSWSQQRQIIHTQHSDSVFHRWDKALNPRSTIYFMTRCQNMSYVSVSRIHMICDNSKCEAIVFPILHVMKDRQINQWPYSLCPYVQRLGKITAKNRQKYLAILYLVSYSLTPKLSL